MPREKIRACRAHNPKRHQLGDDKQVADQRPPAHSAIIDEQQKCQQKGDDRKSHPGPSRLWPERAQVDDEQVRIGCASRQPAEHHHPSDLQSGELSECLAAVNISSTGPAELRCHLAITGNDHAHQGASQQHGPWTQPSHFVGNLRWQPKNPAAQNRIDRKRNQAPAPNRTHQSSAACACLRRLSHRAFVSQAQSTRENSSSGSPTGISA
jgi:hypothetical protein